jgi:hypothetical protein
MKVKSLLGIVELNSSRLRFYKTNWIGMIISQINMEPQGWGINR